MRPNVLALMDHYLPGNRAGGPVRSVQHLVRHLGGDFRFRIVTRDHDACDPAPYHGVVPGRWTAVDGAEVMYLDAARLNPAGLRRVLRAAEYDVLYLNSLFSPQMALAPLVLRRMGALPPRPVVLAPRGELHPGALATGGWKGVLPGPLARRVDSPRQLKKRAYLAAARAAGLFEGVLWQASSPEEAGHIVRAVGRGARVTVAPDLAAGPGAAGAPARPAKRPGELRVAFLSRVDEKKNLHGAIQMLDGVRGDIRFDIYGPVTDAAYWARCQALLARLPANVRTRYHGPLSHDQVPGALAAADVFLFPTLGENFGHVIIEALVQGCPVLTSDQTPWRALAARRAGWDLPLARPSAFRDALQRLADMDDGEYRPWSAGALAMGTAHAADSQAELSNRELFRRAADGGASARTRTATAPVPRSAPVSHRPAPASHRPAPGQTAGTIL